MQGTSLFRITGIMSLLCLAVSVQAAPTFEWVPVRANGGAFTINGNEITLTDHTAPVEVELDLRLSGWGSAMGNPRLLTYSAEVDVNSFASGLGAPLTLKGWPQNPGLGAFIITNTCTLSGNACSPPFDPGCANSTEGFCVSNPDHPFDFVFDLCANNVGIFYCGFSWAGLPDLGNSVHGGYLILDIPTDAQGTYVIELVADPNSTFMVELVGTFIPGLVLTPALITIPLPVGRCCSNIGPTPMCEDNLTEQECQLRPPPFSWVEGATCDGECPCPACQSNADCSDADACTADVCDSTCFQCTNAPNYDEATECCNPSTGITVSIDDDDVCTTGSCDPFSGQVTQEQIPGCVSFDLDAFPKNRYISFETGVLPVNIAFHVRMTASAQFPESIGDLGWVGAPDSKGTALVVPDPVFLPSWPAVVRAGDCEIVPAATYEIRATGDGVNFDPPVVVETTAPPTDKFWGDIVGDFNGVAWTPPNGVLNFVDVQAAIKTFQGGASTAPLIWADLEPETPNRVVNFNEVLWLILAFTGEPYPFSAPADCP